jgi:hypothetical protein
MPRKHSPTPRFQIERQEHPCQPGVHHLKLSKAELCNVYILQGASASRLVLNRHRTIKSVEQPLGDFLRRGVETLNVATTARDMCQLGSSRQT